MPDSPTMIPTVLDRLTTEERRYLHAAWADYDLAVSESRSAILPVLRNRLEHKVALFVVRAMNRELFK